jgi:hypothetical protein
MKSLAIAAVLAVLSSVALASEDNTHRAYGHGPAWYESKCSLQEFNWYAATKEEALRCVAR